MSKEVLIAFDIESTGVSLEADEPIQIGAALFMVADGKFSKRQVLFKSNCKPSKKVDKEAEKVHGISDAMLVHEPSPKLATKSLCLAIESIAKSNTVYTVGYNSEHFDLEILKRFDPSIAKYKHIDVFKIFLRELHTYGIKLVEAYKNYVGKEPENAHDAIADCLFTLEILAKYMKETGQTPEQIYQKLLKPQAYSVMPFGRYVGEPMSKVPKRYVSWCLKNFEHLSPDLKLTFEERLK